MSQGVARPLPKRGLPWLRTSLFLLVLAGVILRAVKNLTRPPVPAASAIDEEDIERQFAARLRVEFGVNLAREPAAFKKQAAEAVRREQERPVEPAPLPPISSHTAASGGDVRTLRSGIPFKTEVKVGKGGIASKERKTANSTLRCRPAHAQPTRPWLMGTPNPKQIIRQSHENKKAKKRLRPIELLFPASGPRARSFNGFRPKSGFLAIDIFGNTLLRPLHWHHIAATRRGDQLMLYLDGVVAARESVGSIPLDHQQIFVGRLNDNASHSRAEARQLVGHIDELAVFSRALTDGELRQLAVTVKWPEQPSAKVAPSTPDLTT